MAKSASRRAVSTRRNSVNPAPAVAAFDDAFIKAVTRDFRTHGLHAIAAVREEDPVTYMKLCASILSKSVKPEPDPLEGMTDEQLIDLARELATALGVAARSGSDAAAKPACSK